MKKPNSLELELIFEAACEHLAAKARDYELDAVRHLTFKSTPPATVNVGPDDTRAESQARAEKEASRCRRLCSLAREMRDAAHGHNFAAIIAEAAALEQEQAEAHIAKKL